jgi:hypothetical protein
MAPRAGRAEARTRDPRALLQRRSLPAHLPARTRSTPAARGDEPATRALEAGLGGLTKRPDREVPGAGELLAVPVLRALGSRQREAERVDLELAALRRIGGDDRDRSDEDDVHANIQRRAGQHRLARNGRLPQVAATALLHPWKAAVTLPLIARRQSTKPLIHVRGCPRPRGPGASRARKAQCRPLTARP